MEEVSRSVSQVGANLHDARQLLSKLENDANIAISNDVAEISSAFEDGESSVRRTAIQSRSYLSQIEDFTAPERNIDMEPQMSWLHKSLESIAVSFESVHAKINRALQCTMRYSYQVLDVKGEVGQNKQKLSDLQTRTESLESQTRSLLNASELRLTEAQDEVAAMQGKIQQKTSDVTSKRQRIKEIRGQISTKEQVIGYLQREEERASDRADIGKGVTVFGLLAAPFTLGLSLVVAGVGVGYAISQSGDVDDLRSAAGQLWLDVKTLNDEISNEEQEIKAAQDAVCVIESRVSNLQYEISTGRSEIAECTRQIQATTHIMSEISELEDYAQSIVSNITEEIHRFQKMKQALDQCSSSIKSKSLDMETLASSAERSSRINNTKRAQQFSKQKELLEHIAQNLEQMHTEMPLLLPLQRVGLLDAGNQNTEQDSALEFSEPIPALSYFSVSV